MVVHMQGRAWRVDRRRTCGFLHVRLFCMIRREEAVGVSKVVRDEAIKRAGLSVEVRAVSRGRGGNYSTFAFSLLRAIMPEVLRGPTN